MLLASFLGIGLGFIGARKDRDLFPHAPVALTVVVAFVLIFPVQVASLAGGRSLSGLPGVPALPIWLELPLIFLGVVVTMAFISDGVARTFARFEPLEAYRLDVIGSIGGIALFGGLSLLNASPVIWGLTVAGTFALLLRGRVGKPQAVAIVGLVLFLAVESFVPVFTWSPYYKLAVGEPSEEGVIDIKVNGIPHQSIVPLERIRKTHSFYFLPYERTAGNRREDALIVGAGAGNDVAVAVSQGVGRIDAVEIDPMLYRVGWQQHPDRPYSDPRVRVHIADGRAYLERTDETYDLVLFALPDSLTLVTGQSSLRLESYLFTVEAMREVKEHLNPQGAFAVYNYYRPFVVDRLAAQLTLVFGHAPCVDLGQGFESRRMAVLTIGRSPDGASCSQSRPALASSGEAALVSDDYPFPYLPQRTIPVFYVVTLSVILGASILLVRAGVGRLSGVRTYLDLFFMGAAFLLLETKSVVQFALLFGTTWFVNALVFAGILLAVLAAIEVSRRYRVRRLALLYLVLLVALAVAWVFPARTLLELAPLPRFLLATVVAFTPIFLANLVFAQRFREVEASTVAFGANLLGAMFGGILEYGALLTGYRHLVTAVAILYTLAFVFLALNAKATRKSASLC